MADIRQKAVATANHYDQGNIAGLDDAMTRRLIASTVLTESHGGDLAVTNKQGYVGRYQASASWLADAGYVDADKLKASMAGYKNEWAWAQAGGMTKFLENPSNWNNGLNLEKYKASDDLQDRAFKTNCDKTYQRAVKEGVLDADDSPAKVAGFLKARHLAGYDGAVAAATGGRVYRDSNGTSNYDYMHDITRNRDGLNQHMVQGERAQAPVSRPAQFAASGLLSPQAQTAGDLAGRAEAAVRGDRPPVAAGGEGKADKDTSTVSGKSQTPTGDFAERAEEAVRRYQEQATPGQSGNVGKQPSTEPVKPQSPAGNFGDRTEEAVRKYQEQAPATNAADKPLISNAGHPDNKLYQQALSNLEQLGPSGGFKSREEMEKAAAAVAVDAKATGLQSIDHISRTTAPSGQNFLVAVQGDPTSAAAKNSYIDYGQAVNQTLEQTTKMAQSLQPSSPTQKAQSEEVPALDNQPRGKTV